jgi:hypothetical protein
VLRRFGQRGGVRWIEQQGRRADNDSTGGSRDEYDGGKANDHDNEPAVQLHEQHPAPEPHQHRY